MPAYKNIRCRIFTKRGLLKEYPGPNGYQPASSKFSAETVYVEAEHLCSFRIECETLRGYRYTVAKNRVEFEVHIDGKHVDCSHLVRQIKPKAQIKGLFLRNEQAGNSFRRFQFSDVSLVDAPDQGRPVNDSALAGVGEIVIYAMRARPMRAKKKDSSSSKQKASAEKLFGETVSEKEIKGRGITHITRLGSKGRSRVSKCSWEKTRTFDTIAKPYACFRILYRSKEALQSLGIIPCAPPPSLVPRYGGLQSSKEAVTGGMSASSPPTAPRYSGLQSSKEAVTGGISAPLPSLAPRYGSLKNSKEVVVCGLSESAIAQEMARLRGQLESLEQYRKHQREVDRSDDAHVKVEDSQSKRRRISKGNGVDYMNEVIDVTANS